jgi:hypothetical protein
MTRDGDLAKGDTTEAGKIRDVKIVSLKGTSDSDEVSWFSTVVRTNAGKLKVIPWKIKANGQLIRKKSWEAGHSSVISAVGLNNSNKIVTAVRDSDNKLKLITWRVKVGSDGEVERLNQWVAGSIQHVDLTQLASNRVATATWDEGDKMKLIIWDIKGDGAIERQGDLVTEKAWGVAALGIH